MSSIEQFISPFIARQFPALYRDEGPNFVAFVKAYYEWLEQSNNAVGYSRSLLDIADIDSTQSQFLKYFKNTYIQSLPESIAADKQLLIKHILDLYRSKGSKRGYELLFRLLFNEDIEVYLPGEYILKPSDNTWVMPRYLEVTSHPKIFELNGSQIQNVGKIGTAIVTNVSERIVNGRKINILELSDLEGYFKRGDRVFQTYGTAVTNLDGPVIVGSLSAIAITGGGTDYAVGDILDVNGSGVEAKAKVITVINDIVGSVRFSILNGGTGYTTNAVVTVEKTINLQLANAQGYFIEGDTIVDVSTNANGTVTTSNATFAEVIDFSPTLSFRVGDEVQTSTGNAIVTRVLGGSGTGATFRVGGITNKEIVNVVSDFITSYTGVQLDNTSNSFDLSVSSISGTFTVGDTVTSTANVIQLEGIVLTGNSVANGESFSNAALGISGLYVYRGDVSLAWCVSSTDSDLTNANLVADVVLTSNLSSSQLQLIRAPYKETITGNAVIEAANATNIRLSSVNGYFVATKTITDANSGATATIDDAERITDWNFPAPFPGADNLDKRIDQVFTYNSLEIGKIAFLSRINPGSGYLTRPYIDVIEPAIAGLSEGDGFGGIKGHNAVISSRIVNGNGIVTAVEVINSGYGFLQNENLTLTSANNNTIVYGSSILYEPGKSEGRWLNRKSFSSDVMKIQDGFYYQNYAYEIVAAKMLASYEDLVRELVHPSGIALFGRYRLIDNIVGEQSSAQEFSLTQA
jgi:hypothetical protein